MQKRKEYSTLSSVIKKIDKDSPLLHKAHIGDKLLSINGNEIIDVLDYKYFSYDTNLKIELESPEGKHRTIKIKKREGGELGIDFETYLMDRARCCSNRCMFCFIDQLPRGMRKTLYFKDDDARLSFLTGNYVTMTNLSEREIQRIIDLHISPINVSVHATEPELRAKMLHNPRGAEGYELMKRLAAGGITMNCQIVCCPGVNDGEALMRSMKDLVALYPQVNSVSIVPVGLTKFRDNLFPLKPFEEKAAGETIDMVMEFSDKCFKEHGSRIFFLSDEFFIKANRPIPPDEYYEDYVQYENGVGILRLLETEFAAAIKNSDENCIGTPFSIACGVSATPFLENLLMTAQKKYGKMHGKVFPIVNDFFGHTIDVSGLVTGGDLISQLRGKVIGERLIIPDTMVRDEDGIFLDDVSLDQVKQELGVKVEVIRSDGWELFEAMMR